LRHLFSALAEPLLARSFDAVYAIYKATDMSEERMRCLRALGNASTPELQQRCARRRTSVLLPLAHGTSSGGRAQVLGHVLRRQGGSSQRDLRRP
jgi:hypothetical protein